MRKITLFALATLTAISAMAVSKQQTQPISVAKADLFKPALRAAVTSEKTLFVGDFKKENASKAAPIASQLPTYVADPAFYIGSLSPSMQTYLIANFAFLPGGGQFSFKNLNEPAADKNEWSWKEFVINSTASGYDTLDYSGNTSDLIWNLEPMMRLASPTLVSTTEATSYIYNDTVKTFYTTGSPYKWGFYGGEDDEEENFDPALQFGCNTCKAYMGENFFREQETSKNTTDKTNFDANGVCKYWADEFTDYKDVKISGYSYRLPAMGRPYQMTGMNLLCLAQTTEESSLTATVYGYDSEGKLDRTKVYGKGTTILPKGQTGGFIYFNLRAIGALGLPTNNPLIIDGPCFIEMTGVENENITAFGPFCNGSLYVPEAEWRNPIWDIVYPQTSIVNFTAVNKETNETEEIGYFFSGGYILGDDQNLISKGTEMCMYFMINYPVIMDPETGKADITYEAPADGATETFFIYSDEDLEQLLADGKLSVENKSDWATVTNIAYSEGASQQLGVSVYSVDVTATALPSTETGRTANIKYTGYACDFTITVVQGDGDDQNSISEIKNAGNGVSEYFDLQGRKLSAAPAKGLYIERNGTAASTKLAR